MPGERAGEINQEPMAKDTTLCYHDPVFHLERGRTGMTPAEPDTGIPGKDYDYEISLPRVGSR